MSTYWDYSCLYGEKTWKQHFRTGLRQSPINILTGAAVRNDDYCKLKLKFVGTDTNYSYENKGYNISFKPIHEKVQSSMSGGPLNGTYCFEECHFHWGRDNNKGAEHEVDGIRYDAELHLVHRLKECDFSDALNRVNGLSVLGVFIEVDDNATTPPFLSHVMNSTKHVNYKGEKSVDSEKWFQYNPYLMLQGISDDYFTYEGSLTTPPLSECVRWVVFKTPMKVSRKDYECLQNIFAVENKSDMKKHHDPFCRTGECSVSCMPKIGDNYRSCCPSDGRKVESCSHE